MPRLTGGRKEGGNERQVFQLADPEIRMGPGRMGERPGRGAPEKADLRVCVNRHVILRRRRADKLPQLAQILGCKIDDLFEGERG